MVEVGVVVPTFNRLSMILSTLDSVAAQTRLPARLVVVDDGSTDGSADAVARWLGEHAELFDTHLIRQRNRGAAAARNRGFAAAMPCALVAFLDSDDCWPPDFLERAASALEECPAAVCAACDREMHGLRGAVRESLEPLVDTPISWILRHGANVMSAMLLRASAIGRVGGFNESLATGEDAALLLPLSLEGPWLHLPGRPVVCDVGQRFRGQSEVNRSSKFCDNARRLARTYEDFVVRGGGAQYLPRSQYARLLSRAWHSAGDELAESGNREDARECFLIAREWNSRGFKTHGRLAMLDLSCLLGRVVQGWTAGRLPLDSPLHRSARPTARAA